jgi:hypothetical protein
MVPTEAYSRKKLARLVKYHGSIRAVAFFASVHHSTLSKYISGARDKLSRPTCTMLDLLYIKTF